MARQRQRLDATFKRARELPAEAEYLSDFARYLCVLVCGFLEQATTELLLEYTRENCDDERILLRMERTLRRITNLNAEALLTTLGNFDSEWRNTLQIFLIDEFKDSVDGIYALRNEIAHGRNVGVTMVRVGDYYARIKVVINKLEEICFAA